MLRRLVVSCALGASMAACGPGYTAGEIPDTEATSASTSGPAVTPGANCTPDTYANYAQAFITTNCALSGCHTTGSAFDDFTVYATVQTNAKQMSNMVSTKQMPLSTGGQVLTPDEITRFTTWLNCGAPQ